MLVLTSPYLKVADQAIAVIIAYAEEDAILVVGVVHVARISCRVDVATCAHMYALLPAS
jgi:hypothetical protein